MSKKLRITFILLSCYHLFSLPLFAQCAGGMVSTNDGSTTYYACVEDDDSDYVAFITNSIAPTDYRFVITNEQNEILDAPENSFLNFNNAGVGICRVWGLSYTGTLSVETGRELMEGISTDGCYSLSSNFVTVIRVQKEPTEVISVAGTTTVEITDNEAATVEYFANPVLTADYRFVIIREDEKIVGLDVTGSFDFATLPEGKYFIWGYSYHGDFLLEVGDRLDGAVATGCATKSTTFILVRKQVPSTITGCQADGAKVKTTTRRSTVYACVGDGVGDYVGFQNTSLSFGAYRYLVTDENNQILALPEDNFINFENVSIGTCRVWGLSYFGDFTGMIGDDVNESALATDCFNVSENFITVVRTSTEETTVSTNTGLNKVEITDNVSATLSFINSGSGATDYVYFITNESQRIVGISMDGDFDFAPLSTGKYFVWGYSYAGNLLLSVGNRLTGAISDGCFEKSDDFVLVRKMVEALIPDPCTANAGTLTIDADPVSLMGGSATVSATPNGDLVLPTDYEVIYILTSSEDIIIQMFSAFTSFTVTEPGLYTLHTLVAELNNIFAPEYFEASGIIIGQTSGTEIPEMIAEQGVCADFDVVGARVNVLPEQGCSADAGFLFADNAEVPLQTFTIVSASHVVEPAVPNNYEVTYLLATTEDGIVQSNGDNPVFVVNEVGTYTIMTLVAETSDPNDPNYLDLNNIDFGTITISDLAMDLEQLGICLDFDAVGAQIRVVEATDPADPRSNTEEEATTVSTEIRDLQLYPNPTQAFLRIQLPGEVNAITPLQLHISQLDGRQIMSQTLQLPTGETQVDLSVDHLATGWHQLIVLQGQQSWIGRFYKM